jgi:hypothetical protein
MPTQEDDQLGIVANVQPLITFSTEISKHLIPEKTLLTSIYSVLAKKERPKVLTLETSRSIVVHIYRVGEASLVTICRKSVKAHGYKPAINHAVTMLNKGRLQT